MPELWFQPPLIIAEMAQSYEGSFDVARETLAAAVASGADAVKFQVFTADELAVPEYRYYALYRKLELSRAQWQALIDLAHASRIQFFADVFGAASATMLAEIGVDAYKIHSADTKNTALMKHVACLGRPVFLSTGGTTLPEIERAVATIRGAGNERICLLDGLQVSPTPLEHTQLRRLAFLRRHFGLAVGCQDHVAAELPLARLLPLVAMGVGADVIEKHLTLWRPLKREDYESALNPDEFATMVQRIREAVPALGAEGYAMLAADLEYRKTMKKHVVAGRDLAAGTCLDEDDIVFRRTNSGAPLLAAEDLVGQRLRRPVARNAVILESDLEPRSRSTRVAAVLLCRAEGTRLYGKPLQRIGPKTILEHLVDQLRIVPAIDDVILAISQGAANEPFVDLAAKLGIDYVLGDEEDGLARMILAAEKASASVVVRFTTECPFIYVENLEEMIRRHLEAEADLTVCENLPEGAYGEIISLAALRRSHDEGTERHRSAWVSLYIFDHPEKFKILRLLPPEPLRRPDIRITVDYPEDLVVCRAIYDALGSAGGLIRIEDIIKFLDSHPELARLNSSISAGTGRIWA